MAKDGNPQRESGLFSAVRGRMALIAAMSLVGAAASVVPMIAIVELARALDPAPGQAVQPGRVWGIAGVAIGALVLSFATVGASLIISHLADNDLQLDLRRRIVEHLRELPLGWFDTRSSGLVKKVAENDVAALHQLVAHAVQDLTAAVTVPVISAVYLFAVDWRLALASLAPLVAGFACFALMMVKSTPRYAEYDASLVRLGAATIEYVHGIAVVKAFGQAGASHSRYRRETTDFLGEHGGGRGVRAVRGPGRGAARFPGRRPRPEGPRVGAGQIVRANTPTAPSATLPAGASVLPGKQTVTLPGPGSWQTANVALPASAGSGYYSLRWCLDPADQGANVKYMTGGPYCDSYFSATELFTVPMTLGVTTKVPESRIDKGAPADDVITVSLPDGADQWMAGPDGKPVAVKARGALYGGSAPFAEQADPPAGAVKLGEATVSVALPTSGRDPVSVPAPAGFDLVGSTHWTWVWEIRRADQTPAVAALLAGDARDAFGKAGESGYAPMTLAIASALPDQHRAKGQAPDDTITVSLPNLDDQWIALPSGKPATVKADGVFYAGSASSFTISETPPVDAKPLGTASVNVTLPTSGREPVTVAAPAGFAVPSAQYGTWVWRIDRARQTPDVAALFDNDPADRFGQQLETHVTQMELAIGSEVAEASATEPKGDATAQVCDNVWVEHASPADLWLNQWGADNPVEVKVGGALHHSAVPGPQTTAIDPSTPVVDQYRLTFTAAGKEHAQKVCHTVSYGEYGAYGFAWRIDLADQPEPTKGYLSKGVVTPLWLPVETTMVKRVPVIHTAATLWAATNGGAEEVFFTDEIWQIDWPDAPDPF